MIFVIFLTDFCDFFKRFCDFCDFIKDICDFCDFFKIFFYYMYEIF